MSLIDNDYLALRHSGACLQRMYQILSHAKRLHFTHEVNLRILQRTIVPSSIMNNLVSLMEMQCVYFDGRNRIQIYYLKESEDSKSLNRKTAVMLSHFQDHSLLGCSGK